MWLMVTFDRANTMSDTEHSRPSLLFLSAAERCSWMGGRGGLHKMSSGGKTETAGRRLNTLSKKHPFLPVQKKDVHKRHYLLCVKAHIWDPSSTFKGALIN